MFFAIGCSKSNSTYSLALTNGRRAHRNRFPPCRSRAASRSRFSTLWDQPDGGSRLLIEVSGWSPHAAGAIARPRTSRVSAPAGQAIRRFVDLVPTVRSPPGSSGGRRWAVLLAASGQIPLAIDAKNLPARRVAVFRWPWGTSAGPVSSTAVWRRSRTCAASQARPPPTGPRRRSARAEVRRCRRRRPPTAATTAAATSRHGGHGGSLRCGVGRSCQRMPVTDPKGAMARPTRGCRRSLIGGWHNPRIRWRAPP